MGQGEIKSNLDGNLCCYQCYSFYLIEIIETTNDILIKKYCYCGISTSSLNKHIIYSILKFDFYKNIKCHTTQEIYDDNIIINYCIQCKQFLCGECSIKHNHKIFINAKEVISKCNFHREMNLIGFCKNCLISICEKCLTNKNLHKNHEIIYSKDLNIDSIIIEKFKHNLYKAFTDLDNLIKLKYDNKYKIEISNLCRPQNKNYFEENEQKIILCLELLKTFLDLYYYHKINNSLNYQIISNIYKHTDFQILKFLGKDEDTVLKERIKERIISISNDKEYFPKNASIFNSFGNYIYKYNWITNHKNELFNIGFTIQLKNRIHTKMLINIEDIEPLYINYNTIPKIIKLKNGDLVYYYFNYNQFQKIIFYRDLKIFKYLEEKDYIIDFIQLENKNFIILMSDKIIFYNIENIVFQKNKMIILDNNKIYYKMKSLSDNNISILSFSKDNKSYLTLLNYPIYKVKDIKLLDIKNSGGDLIQINNLIIICFALLDHCKVFLLNLKNNILESFNIKFSQTDNSKVKCFKISNDKILLSTTQTGLIINIEEKQVQTFIKHFRNINSIEKIGNLTLAGLNKKFTQIDIKKGKLYNEFIANFDHNNIQSRKNLLTIIDVGNNQFCLICDYGGIYLVRYNK